MKATRTAASSGVQLTISDVLKRHGISFADIRTAVSRAVSEGYPLLPSIRRRQIVGCWRILDRKLPETRAIELVNGRYYAVRRSIDTSGKRVGGVRGTPLERLSDTLFGVLGTKSGGSYEITPDRGLRGTWIGEDGEEVIVDGIPHPKLWID